MNEFMSNYLKQTIKSTLEKLNGVDPNIQFTSSFYEPTNSIVLTKYVIKGTQK